MNIRIALAGNPNSGKTTLFNALTGSNQYTGNWPGVTVEKKEGKLKGYGKGEKQVTVVDLPGIYSLSPYTLEEVVSRKYLLEEKPEALINIIDGTNLERNLYLTTQLKETGIPMVVAVNMMDVVRKNGEELNRVQMEKELGCPVVEISALKEEGIDALIDLAVSTAEKAQAGKGLLFDASLEKVISSIENLIKDQIPSGNERWYAIKLFERDEKVRESLSLSEKTLDEIEAIIDKCEKEYDDDSESIITSARYHQIEAMIHNCYTKRNRQSESVSDRIDRIVTNRILALPIFAVVMFLVYYVSVTTVGSILTDFVNDGFDFIQCLGT